MSKLEDMKREYDSINASEEFRNNMENLIQKEKGRFSIMKKISVLAGGLAAAFILTVNFVPGVAVEAQDVPVLGTVVNVVTFGRFEKEDGNIRAEVDTPKIQGLVSPELESKLNEEFKDNSEDIIKAFESDVLKLREESGDKDVHYEVKSDYSVKTNNDRVLSIDTYIESISGSSSNVHRIYNIDKNTGERIMLSDILDDGYAEVISTYIKDEMKKENRKNPGSYFLAEDPESMGEGFSEISENNNFYINDGGNIVIVFDEYQVAPGSMGSPEFEIPSDVIEDILK